MQHFLIKNCRDLLGLFENDDSIFFIFFIFCFLDDKKISSKGSTTQIKVLNGDIYRQFYVLLNNTMLNYFLNSF